MLTAQSLKDTPQPSLCPIKLFPVIPLLLLKHNPLNEDHPLKLTAQKEKADPTAESPWLLTQAQSPDYLQFPIDTCLQHNKERTQMDLNHLLGINF